MSLGPARGMVAHVGVQPAMALAHRPLGSGSGEGIRLGPPREVPGFGIELGDFEVGTGWCGPGNRKLLVADMNGSRVHLYEIGDSCREIWQMPMPRGLHATGSPDGRWVVAGSFEGGSGVRIWDADTGRLEKELAIGDASVGFSPDSRWLYTTTARLSVHGAELCAWRIGSWEAERRLALIRTSSSPVQVGVAPDGPSWRCLIATRPYDCCGPNPSRRLPR